jgi:hypothetical protein
VYEPDYEQEYVEDGVKCEKCGGTYAEGDYPFCKGYPESHGPMGGHYEPMTPYVDIQLLDRKDPRCTDVNELGIRGVPITTRGDRHRIMKEQGLQFGTQKFDEKRGKVLYGGAATSERFKSRQGHKRRQKPPAGDPRRKER